MFACVASSWGEPGPHLEEEEEEEQAGCVLRLWKKFLQTQQLERVLSRVFD